MNHFSQEIVFWSLAGLAILAAALAVWLVARAAKPNAAVIAVAPRPWFALKTGWLGKWLQAVVYLFTSREPRYARPWVLILGEKGAGKSSLARSYAHRLRFSPPARPDIERLEGIGVYAFESGQLIDPEGRLCSAAERTGDAERWQAALHAIDILRPERPIDKIVLVVSARSLLTGDEDELQRKASEALVQLNAVRQRFEFVLPVYLVVTQCDAVPGFAEFWRAQPDAIRQQMFGWSVSPAMQSLPPEEWPNTAFATLNERLRLQLLKVAASRAKVADTDQVFLFPVGFRRLAGPLGRWFQTVFQPDNWNQKYFCRGIYFSGSVTAGGCQEDGIRLDVDFLPDLMRERVFGETHLAAPSRKSIWSRNRLIRRVQYSGVALLVALLGALTWSSYHIHSQVKHLEGTLKSIADTNPALAAGTCLDADQAYALLRHVPRIDSRPVYPAIPLSWVDERVMRHTANKVSEDVFKDIIMPGIACRMNGKIQALLAAAEAKPAKPQPGGGEKLSENRRHFLDYVKAVTELERNIANYAQVSRSVDALQLAKTIKAFKELSAYAFGKPVPDELDFDQGMLGRALIHFSYDQKLVMPANGPQRFARRIRDLSAELHKAMNAELAAGAALMANLGRSNYVESGLQEDTSHLLWWLNWMRQSWLGADAKRNPCQEIHAAAAPDLAFLDDALKSPKALQGVADSYGEKQCFRPALDTLAGLHVAPYGNLFLLNAGKLELNKDLIPEFLGLAAVMDLRYMRLTPTRAFQRLPDISGWNAATLVEATGYAREYMTFAQAKGLPAATPDGKRSLYDQLARRHLLAVLNERLNDAQIAPAPPRAEAGVHSLSADERRLSRESADFAGAAGPLLDILGLYRQLGFAADAREIANTVRDFADDNLGRAHGLALASQLYDAGSPEGDAFPLPGDLAVTKDWLSRQAARARVLGGYASQYVAFLKNSQTLVEQQWQDRRDAAFWDNTIGELERHLQFKEPNGQVAHLEAIFLKLLPAITAANCRKQLADYAVPDYGNDLFSQLRRQRTALIQDHCSQRHDAPALRAYQTMAERFNRELAGRFPFGGLNERDASPTAVKDFLADYAAQRDQLRGLFDGAGKAKLPEVRRFVDQMDGVAAFFRGNLSQTPASGPLRLVVHFNNQPKLSQDANQVLSWTLSNGSASAAYPNQPTTLEWNWGQRLDLRLAWASGSRWRPVPDARQADLTADGVNAVFKSGGPWALLRLIKSHRPAGGSGDPLNPDVLQLEFAVPVSAAQTAGPAKRSLGRLYLGLEISDRKATTPLAWPVFPTAAPTAGEETPVLPTPTAKRATNSKRSKT